MARAAISAHRVGAQDDVPESYDAYRSAAASGADFVEIDIRRTRDGVLVAYHDERCGPHGPAVAELTYGELCEYVGSLVPRATEAMWVLAGKVAGHLDLKEAGYESQVVEVALEAFGADGFVVTTLEDASIARIRREFPDVRTALSLGRDLDGLPPHRRAAARLSEMFPVRRLQACGAQWAALDYRLVYAGVLRQCAAHDVGTMLWTVDRDDLITRFLKDPRVNVLITNRPSHARTLRDALEET